MHERQIYQSEEHDYEGRSSFFSFALIISAGTKSLSENLVNPFLYQSNLSHMISLVFHDMIPGPVIIHR